MVTAAKKAAASKPAPAATTTPAVNHRLAANNAAIARLRDAHLDEFHDLLEQECANRGIAYERPLSPKEKARKQILDLIAKNGGDVIPTQDEVAAALAPKAKPVAEVIDEEGLAADEPDATVMADVD